MKKLLTLICLNFILLLTSSSTIFSQDSTEVRLQQVENKLATAESKAATDSTKANNQKTISFIEGSVVATSEGVLTISADSTIKRVYTTDSTKFINFDSGGKKLIGFGDIKVNDTIMVIGLPTTNSSGTAKLIIRDLNKISKTFSIIGKIAEVKDASLKLAHFSRSDFPSVNLTLTPETSMTNQKNKRLERSALINQQTIIASGMIDEKGTFVGQSIYLLDNKPQTAATSAK